VNLIELLEDIKYFLEYGDLNEEAPNMIGELIQRIEEYLDENT